MSNLHTLLSLVANLVQSQPINYCTAYVALELTVSFEQCTHVTLVRQLDLRSMGGPCTDSERLHKLCAATLKNQQEIYAEEL